MSPHGPIRREAEIDKIAAVYEQYGLTPEQRSLVMGAARSGFVEAIRCVMFMPDMSPSRRVAMEDYWGLSGTTRSGL